MTDPQTDAYHDSDYLSGKSILITGGTGSFGKAFVRWLLKNCDPQRIVVFSRDELKQYEFRSSLGDDDRCLLYTSDAADERSSVALGGRRIIKKKKSKKKKTRHTVYTQSY